MTKGRESLEESYEGRDHLSSGALDRNHRCFQISLVVTDVSKWHRLSPLLGSYHSLRPKLGLKPRVHYSLIHSFNAGTTGLI